MMIFLLPTIHPDGVKQAVAFAGLFALSLLSSEK